MNLLSIIIKNAALAFILLIYQVSGNAFANTLSGSIQLPNNANATFDIGVIVDLLIYDSSGNLVPDDTGIFHYEKSDYALIEEGENSASYFLDYSDAPDGYRYEISAYCSNCDFYLSSRLYLQDDGSSGLEYNTIVPDLVPSEADFELIAPTELSGTISLPNGDTAVQDMDIRLRLFSSDKNGSSLSSLSELVTIQSGESSVSFSMLYQLAPAQGSYSFSVECSFGCASKYVDVNMILQEDGGFNFGLFESGTVSVLPQNIDLELIPVNNVTGTVSLPNNQLADFDMRVRLILETNDEAGEVITFNLVNIIIKQGENYSSYELSYPPSPDNWSHRFRAFFNGASEIYSSQNLYLKIDGTTGAGFASVSGTSIPSVVNFELLELQEIEGIVQLPEVVDTDMEIGVTVWAYDKNENFVATDSLRMTIDSGSSSSPFRLKYRPASLDGFYTLSIACFDNCNSLLLESIYLKSANQCRSERTLIRAAIMPDYARFAFPECLLESDFVMPPIMLLLDN